VDDYIKTLFAESAEAGHIVLFGDGSVRSEWRPEYSMWRAAHAEAEAAWQDWRRSRDVRDFIGYQAALDREDAAQRALAAHA
jgi:hypothetical protein